MKLCFIDLGTATEQTREPGGASVFDDLGFLFG
jgi:hypothetical protein